MTRHHLALVVLVLALVIPDPRAEETDPQQPDADRHVSGRGQHVG